MTPQLSSYINTLPKVELHVHLEGSLARPTVIELAEKNGIPVPDAVTESSRYTNFNEFATSLLAHSRTLRTTDDFALAVYRMGESLSLQNVKYAEVIWAPQLHLRKGLLADQILAAMNSARVSLRREFGLELRWIVDLVRRFPDVAQKVQRWACQRQSAGIVALGLGGPEAGMDTDRFVEMFADARRQGLPANPHAGEDGNSGEVWRAVKDFGARRIGHGIRILDDPELMDFIIEQGITLEVCPTSNLRMSLVDSYQVHPLKQLVDRGCKVTINSDDPYLFATSLCNEYLVALRECGLTVPQLLDTVINAVEAAYLPADEKDLLRKKIETELAAIDAPDDEGTQDIDTPGTNEHQ